MTIAYLILDDGTAFPGTAWGATGATVADLEICTLMTGYQEVLTSEKSAGKIILMTAPHIGNVGMNDETSTTFTAAGLVAREPARRPSNWKTTGSFDEALAAQNLIAIAGVDTRAVTLHIRQAGRPFRAAIVSGDALPRHAGQSTQDDTAEVVKAALEILATSKEQH